MTMLPRQNSVRWTVLVLVIAGVGIGNAQAQPQFDAEPDSGSDAATFQEPSPLPSGGVLQPPPSMPSIAPVTDETTPGLPSPSSDGSGQTTDAKRTIEIRYVVERPVWETFSEGGKVYQVTRYVKEARVAKIVTGANLDELDLPPDGKRAAVLAVTAARHEDLLKELKEAEGDEEKKQAADALKENYTEHYAIETWWREQRLTDLENRLKEMREQVQQRQEAQEKYIEAAMTIAELWAQGIAIEPPKPGSGTKHGNTTVPTDMAPALTPNSGTWLPATSESQPSVTLPGPASSAPVPATIAR